MKKKILNKYTAIKVFDAVASSVMTGISAGAGIAVTKYCVDHDIMNDKESSVGAGIAAGATTVCLTGTVLKAAEKTLVNKMYNKYLETL